MNLKLFINRAVISLDALLSRLIKPKKSVKDRGKKIVLIVFQQLFGDAVIVQSSLGAYLKAFPENENYRIILLARPSVCSFMKDVLEIPAGISIEPIDFNRFLQDYRFYRQVRRKYRGTADIIIVPGTSLTAEIFSTMSGAVRRVGLLRYRDVQSPFIMALFNRIAYTERVRPDKDDMMLQHHRILLNYLGVDEYKAKLPSVLYQENIIQEEQYCVMCPGASKMEKCWPPERFALIADYIVEKYGINIHLCGGNDELGFEKMILSMVKYPQNIVSHIGKTSFINWSAIVQHADLVVGNDSATMHLAVASRRKAICIVGVYDKYQFFPYKVDQLSDGDILPASIVKDMPCERCRTIGYYAGYGNKMCKKRINKNHCVLCIDIITPNDVINEIDRAFSQTHHTVETIRHL
ncbi:MAG: glycosyltransferase family 9 protein [Lachnospiraceae bacterium]|nr:glycosyltransferase family 9 protein [Lachnospiraceae bacterium]